VSEADLHTKLEGEMGHVPDAIARYTRLDPGIMEAYTEFRSAVLDGGVLDRKVKLLMVIALLTAMKEREPMRLYALIARKEGVTPEEIMDALRVGVLFSGGAGMAAAASIADVLEEAAPEAG
jgi:alkylhydroperoxidase/carboxymuconolactone decarboxylase family protein YurZ